MTELSKNMREALRVNKAFTVFSFYKFTDNNTILARFSLELKEATGRSSTRYR